MIFGNVVSLNSTRDDFCNDDFTATVLERDNVCECQLNSYFAFQTYVVTDILPWNSYSITSPFVSTKVSLLPLRSLKRGEKLGRGAWGIKGRRKGSFPHRPPRSHFTKLLK